MASYNYKPGLGNGASYEVSGVPYAKGAVNAMADGGAVVRFPRVTRWVVIANNPGGGNLKVGFSQDGVTTGNAFIEIPNQSVSPRLELKVTEIWLSGSTNCGVMAGLTGIETTAIDNIAVSPSGSNWSGSLAARVG